MKLALLNEIDERVRLSIRRAQSTNDLNDWAVALEQVKRSGQKFTPKFGNMNVDLIVRALGIQDNVVVGEHDWIANVNALPLTDSMIAERLAGKFEVDFNSKNKNVDPLISVPYHPDDADSDNPSWMITISKLHLPYLLMTLAAGGSVMPVLTYELNRLRLGLY